MPKELYLPSFSQVLKKNYQYKPKNKYIRKKTQKVCLICHTEFMGIGNSKYCSKQCCQEATDIYSGTTRYPYLSTSTKGSIKELIVSVDLMKKGFEVFRALSPTCSCDLVICINGKTYRVEVKSGLRKKDGTLRFPKNKVNPDFYAVVCGNDVTYISIPENDILSEIGLQSR